MASAKIRQIVTVLAALMSNMWWLVALMAPSYHYQQLVVLDLFLMFTDISLWRLYVKSECRSQFTSWTTANNVKMYGDEVLCHNLLSRIDGQTLNDAVALMCEIQKTLFNLPDMGCVALSNLALASRIFIFAIVMSMISNFIVVAATFIFFNCRPTIKVRAIILVAAASGVLFTAFGYFVYIYLGGQLNEKILGSILTLIFNESKNYSFISYSLGFLVATLAVALQLGCSVLAFVLVKSSLCVDKARYDDDEEEESVETLLDKYWHGQYKMIV